MSFLVALCLWHGAATFAAPQEITVIWSGDTTSRKVALTFDDGPHHQNTGRILDLLGEAGARATFFIVGRHLETCGSEGERLLRRMRAEGHEIGNHSYSHANVSRLSLAKLRIEVERTQALVERVTGEKPALFRPPGGGMDFATVRSLAGTGLRGIVMWSIDPSDWTDPGREKIWREVADKTEAGSIILLHDSHAGTVRALPLLIDLLQARGFELVTVSELIQSGT